MFETNVSHKLEVPDFARDPGMEYWATVERSIHTPWIHVTYRLLASEVFRIFYLLNPEHLIDLARSSECEIAEAYLVLPPYMNQSELWQMLPIFEVWRAPQHLNPKSYAYFFRDRQGNNHQWDIGEVRADLEELERVIAFPKP